MAIFVLVHGAWAGGWGYKHVARRLRAAGHEVYTPSLTGLGERAHLLSGDIDLSTHIADVANVFLYENINNVILVGHSYGGMVVTGVASECANRIRTLVYLDAFLPEDGQSLWDIASEQGRDMYIRNQRDTPGMVTPMLFPGQREEGRTSSRPPNSHPLLTLTQPVKLSGAEKSIKNRTYILANKMQPAGFQRFYDKIKALNDASWRLATIATGHVVMSEDPEGLSKLLLEEVAR